MDDERRRQEERATDLRSKELDGGSGALIRILLVDGSEEVRRGLAIALASTDDLYVVGDAANGEQALRGCAELHPEVVLMEIHLADQDGVGLIQQLRSRHLGTRVVVLTSDTSPEMRDRVVSAGAHSVLHKYVTSAQLIAAIRKTREP